MLSQESPSNNTQTIPKLRLMETGATKQKVVYSSRSNSIQPSLQNSQSSPSKNRQGNSSASKRIKSGNRTINVLSVDNGLLDSIRRIKQHQHQPGLNIIKHHGQKMLENNSRQNRLCLVDVLQQIQPFFSKIHMHIAEAIILLGKPVMYYKGQLIFDTLQQQQQHRLIPTKGRSEEDIGFIIYGKVQLSNDKVFYWQSLGGGGTLFENKFIGRRDKISYYVDVCEPTLIVWLSRQSYQIVRKQCFLTLDLKYKFGQFQNLLKLNMVRKKLPQEVKV